MPAHVPKRATLHIRQSNSALGLGVLQRLRDLADVSVEATPQNLWFLADDYARLGAMIKASPPFRAPADVMFLREAVRRGRIDIVCTDLAPHALDEKQRSYSASADISGGMAGVQTLLPAMPHMVQAGILQFTDIARPSAANLARRFGLIHRKGAISPGLYADIVVVDTCTPNLIRNDEQHGKADVTPFAEMSAPASIERTLLRGRTVALGSRVGPERSGLVLGENGGAR